MGRVCVGPSEDKESVSSRCGQTSDWALIGGAALDFSHRFSETLKKNPTVAQLQSYKLMHVSLSIAFRSEDEKYLKDLVAAK